MRKRMPSRAGIVLAVTLFLLLSAYGRTEDDALDSFKVVYPAHFEYSHTIESAAEAVTIESISED
jgi:hypothetical protein